MMESERSMINHLIAQQLKGEELTSEEREKLNQWLDDGENKIFFDELSDNDSLLEKLETYHHFQAATNAGKQRFAELGGGIKIRSLKDHINWQRYVAAASVFFLLATGTYMWFYWSKDKADTTLSGGSQVAIIPPGKDGAVLTLDGGQQVVLDDAADGTVAQQGAAQVDKQGSVLAYKASGDEVVHNILTTPRGRQYQLALADGSRVWLNAASSVRFPSAFPGKERRIEISGECYLEIAKDAGKPFVVSVSGMEVEVLGTSFNINSYPEEGSIKTTLIEGKVKIRKGAKTTMMSPGQQAQVSGEGIKLVENADVEGAIAWKNGMIVLSGTEIKYLLSSISRWYDVEVEVQGAVEPELFYGSIPRTLSLQDVAKALGNITNLKFTFEGKKMIVSQ